MVVVEVEVEAEVEVGMVVDTVMARRPLAMVAVEEAMAVDMVEVEVDGGKSAFLPLASQLPPRRP